MPDAGELSCRIQEALLASMDRSRLCEQIWLDSDLFKAQEGDSIYALDEEAYKESGVLAAASPGSLGEQLLFRQLMPGVLSAGLHIMIADAILEVIRVGLAIELRILEPGLVEPGAPILLHEPSQTAIKRNCR